MKRMVIGILAHVDSGKTTLSEALLYKAGEIRKLGRVDHKNSFLDTDTIERERGITIFSKEAQITMPDIEITLLDTPGHVDFRAEAERTLQVLDYAILVISATDIVKSHTQTLWKLLRNNNIPTFIFVNKMDLENSGQDELIKQIKEKLSENIIDFSADIKKTYEEIAMCDEESLEEFLEKGEISFDKIVSAVSSQKVFPCYFGSALKNDGIDEFFDGIIKYTENREYPEEFAAKVYKISEDEKGKRLTHLKVTGGKIKVKDLLSGNGWQEKVNELRIYSGLGYKNVGEVSAGNICAVVGLTKSYSGEGLGIEPDSQDLTSEAVFSYSVKLPDGYDINNALEIFKKLRDEDSKLGVDFSKQTNTINIRIMGQIQLEVLKQRLSEKYGLDVSFEHGSIVYKETIEDTVEGVGHYEPLRHYAEVHLLMEPLKRGSGLVFSVDCDDNVLDKSKKNLVMTHLLEKQHIGVLTGSPLTDMKITLINGKAHLKHTEGGDFREATYRAVRHGLMLAKSILLEPYYNFLLEIPTENTGRAMTDLELMGAKYSAPETLNEITVIKGNCPVSKIQDYQIEVISYTKGRGKLGLEFMGYDECVNSDEVIERIGYNSEADIENTADSVFCAHGGGFHVKWDKVYEHMHLPLRTQKNEYIEENLQRKEPRRIIADDNELLRIFESIYGKIKQKTYHSMNTRKEPVEYKAKNVVKLETYLLIDGYNIIHSWDFLKEISNESLNDARELLISKICTLKAISDKHIILVFDAYKVRGGEQHIENINGISVVYTKEAETADSYIEKTAHELKKNYNVRVATSDGLEQMIIFGSGAVRVTPKELYDEVFLAEKEIRDFIEKNNVKTQNLN